MSKLTIVQHVFEYLLVFIMTAGGINVILTRGAEIATTTAIGEALANPWLIAAFGVAFTFGGIMLLCSKLFRKNRCHQIALTIIFASNLFGVLVGILILGFASFGWVNSLIIAIVAGLIHFKRDGETKVRSARWLTRHARRSIM